MHCYHCHGDQFRSMTPTAAQEQTRILVQAAAKVCEDKKGEDTRILELDPVDSGLSDFFLITSALNDRQAQAIADDIEFTLKRDYGVYATSVEGRRQGEWILLDYVDFVVHVFRTEKRAFYDIERLRKSARPLTPAEFDAELKAALAAKTRATRSKTGITGDGSSPLRRKTAPAKVSGESEATKTAKHSKAAVAKGTKPAQKTPAPTGKKPSRKH
jgi:ribosome-associated protein